MRSRAALLCSLALLITFNGAACSRGTGAPAPPRLASEAFPGGEGSVKFKPFASFELPAANLPQAQRPHFHAGKALGNQPWIKAPTATDARDGLGPVYNARTCLACHVNGGRGRVPDSGEQPIFSAIVRLSVPGTYDHELGSQPEPVYGDQIQGQSVALSHQLRGRVPLKDPVTNPEAPPEARVFIDWLEKEFIYPDGEVRLLRYPSTRFEELGYGELQQQTQRSLRAAPAIHGLGLLEAVDQASVDALADPDDKDGDGISGRVNQVWDFEAAATVPGRFGWKANRANLRITTAGAFQGDVGISNPVFPEQPCSNAQRRCRRTPTGNNSEGMELPEPMLALTTNFVRNIGVPRARELTERAALGRNHFHESGCAACHNPSFRTSPQAADFAHLGDQVIWPYTDLLLHDMGHELADGRPDYTASGSEWRTPPLWGLGLSQRVNGVNTLLHDGRARTVEEAVLWHGGEAGASRDAFAALKRVDRDALVAFVESL
ncbi:MAG: di-heme oxidoredictase family protein [Pseudomonadota bacterium]